MNTAAIDDGGGAAALAALHACRSVGELHGKLAAALQGLLGPASYALALAAEPKGRYRVEFAGGTACPVAPGQVFEASAWPEACDLEIRFEQHLLGRLFVERGTTAADRRALAALVTHYATALVAHTLHAEARQATEHYCASLQALEEGIVLFQEQDPAAVLARLLSLAMAMVQSTAGILYVLREVGDPRSGLRADQVLGLPEDLVDRFRSMRDGNWPADLVGTSPVWCRREADGSLAGLAPDCLPPMVTNLVAVPLCYHGVDAGLCVLFNVAIDEANSRDLLSRLQSLGQLGAALLHRLELEAISARNRSIARELEIASTIQRRLVPTCAPATARFEFAWCSIAARSIGGDYIDLIGGETGDIHAIVADAAGHGIDSALLMSSFRANYRAEAPWTAPQELLASLNREVVYEVGATGMFITAAALRIEQETRRITLSSAGHNPVLLYRAADGSIERIESHGPPLGFVDGERFDCFRGELAPGDVLVLYTDGITEAVDGALEMFGEERLAALLLTHCRASAQALLEAVQQELAAFTGRTQNEDDVSMTVIRVR